MSGAEAKLRDELILLFKCVFTENRCPILEFVFFVAVAVECFFVSHKPRSIRGFSTNPISTKRAVS